jgi:hypothetical protein
MANSDAMIRDSRSRLRLITIFQSMNAFPGSQQNGEIIGGDWRRGMSIFDED